MEKNKPKWGKPKLIVLVRGEPGERLLYVCKTNYMAMDESSIDVGCYKDITSLCMLCAGLTGS
jgi:hypothetical protein